MSSPLPTDLDTLPRQPLLYIVSSPSGAGKTSLCRGLLESDPHIRLSISATTRPPRPSEREGINYFFMNSEDFMIRREAGEFLEWAEMFGRFYATPRRFVESCQQKGYDILFDIDGKGTRQIAASVPSKYLVRLFLLPPSRDILYERLRRRAEDAEEVVAARMAGVDTELDYFRDYDYVLINHDYDKTLNRMKEILAVERRRRHRILGLEDHIAVLRQKPA